MPKRSQRSAKAATASKRPLVDTDPVAFLTNDVRAVCVLAAVNAQQHVQQADFFAATWERQPRVFRAVDARIEFFEGLCNFDALLHVATAAEAMDDAMQWGIDVNAARFINGARETLNGDGDVAPEELKHLYTDQGCTLQVHQPQRWDATIHRIVAALESKFGCLIGCNSYITPENTQGLAPHYDDVDVFVCQTSGTKRWFVYNVEAGGPAGHLTTKSSPDLDVDNLPKKPLLDVELSPGDVLYMPRGTVHQAQANQGGSSHLTLSAYQRWNFATLATTLLACMAENAPMGMQHDNPCVLPEDLRRGLPVGWLYNAGLQAALESAAGGAAAAAPATPGSKRQKKGSKKGPDASKPTASDGAKAAATGLAAGLRALAAAVESQPELLDVAADAMAFDLWQHRAPPHPEQLSHQEQGACPQDVDNTVAPVAPPEVHLTRLVPCSPPEPGMGRCVRLLSCLHNDITRHMMGAAGELTDNDDEDDEADDDELEHGCDLDGCGHDHHAPHPQGNPDDVPSASDDVPELVQVDNSDEEGSFDSDEADEEGGDLVFEPQHLPALRVLLGGEGRVGDVPVEVSAPGEAGEAAVELAAALWNEQLLARVE